MKNIVSSKSAFLIVVSIIIIFAAGSLSAQYSNSKKVIDTYGFNDSAHHWKDITDHHQVIVRLKNQKEFNPGQIKNIADNILLYQQHNGGWPKNYDMLAVLTKDQKNILAEGKDSINTTFDNGATYSQIDYLAKAYSVIKDQRYKKAALKGIDFILKAQYKNGGWPQFYPDTHGYRKYITYNDSAMIGIMDVLRQIVQNKSYFSFVKGKRKEEVLKAFEKGIDCILNTQIKENGRLTVWCQQHDNITLKPRGARTFELPGKCSEESAQLVLVLMKLEHPDKKVVNSIKAAVRWFKDSELKNLKLKSVPAPKVVYKYHEADSDKIVIKDLNAPPIWARYYTLKTNKPFFANRDGKMVYKFSDVARERRTGYGWYVYTPQEVLDKYPEWLKKIGKQMKNNID